MQRCLHDSLYFYALPYQNFTAYIQLFSKYRASEFIDQPLGRTKRLCWTEVEESIDKRKMRMAREKILRFLSNIVAFFKVINLHESHRSEWRNNKKLARHIVMIYLASFYYTNRISSCLPNPWAILFNVEIEGRDWPFSMRLMFDWRIPVRSASSDCVKCCSFRAFRIIIISWYSSSPWSHSFLKVFFSVVLVGIYRSRPLWSSPYIMMTI